MKEKKIKKQEARQNAKLEDKQLDQVQGGLIQKVAIKGGCRRDRDKIRKVLSL